MPSRQRFRTDYPGVYYVETPRRGKEGVERVYYIVFRVEGRQYEEVAGWQFRDAMTPMRASLIRGERIESRRISANELRRERKYTLNLLWDMYAEANEGKASLLGDRCRYDKHIRGRIGEKAHSELMTVDIDRIRIDLLKKLSPQTVFHVLSQIKRILRYGVRKGLIRNIDHLQFEMPKVDNQRTEMLTREELKRFIRELNRESDKVGAAGVRLALLTGMRHSAIAALKWADIDFERGRIVLRGETAKNGKTSVIPMGDSVRSVLIPLRRPGAEYVFPGRVNGHRGSFRSVALRIKRAAGLPESFRCMHGLRHTFASMLASSGKVDLYTLQRLLTHETQKMTERYSHLTDEALQRASGVMGEIVGEIS